jgi:7,8-dihydropterin-6-yl-methyl-4-(beta-D-ribofuranosyl)aminobenzene 5'-phosphate synthase
MQLRGVLVRSFARGLALALALATACGGPGATPPVSPAGSLSAAPPAAATVAAPREAARAVKVTILSTMLSDERLGEWGFSALVEIDGHPILFDTGAHPDTVLKNAEELGIDLSQVTDVVLSHNHDDHTGGLVTLRRELMKKNPAALSRAHVAPPIFWSRPGPPAERNSMIATRTEYEALGGTFVFHDKWERLARGVFLSGPVPRVHPEKNYGRNGHIGALASPSGVVNDDVPEEMSLVVVTDQGLVIVTGCGHAGIVNGFEQAVRETGEPRVHAAIGGFHLFAASEDTLKWTADRLAPMHIAHLVGAHCTGIESLHRLRTLLALDRKTAVVGAVGATFELGKGIDPGEIAR